LPPKTVLRFVVITRYVVKLKIYDIKGTIMAYVCARARACVYIYILPWALDNSYTYEGVSKSFRTGRLERELQMVQLSATRCSRIAIL
jgi:hypothetical protein